MSIVVRKSSMSFSKLISVAQSHNNCQSARDLRVGEINSTQFCHGEGDNKMVKLQVGYCRYHLTLKRKCNSFNYVGILVLNWRIILSLPYFSKRLGYVAINLSASQLTYTVTGVKPQFICDINIFSIFTKY